MCDNTIFLFDLIPSNTKASTPKPIPHRLSTQVTFIAVYWSEITPNDASFSVCHTAEFESFSPAMM